MATADQMLRAEAGQYLSLEEEPLLGSCLPDSECRRRCAPYRLGEQLTLSNKIVVYFRNSVCFGVCVHM